MNNIVQKYNSIINNVDKNLWVDYANSLEISVNHLKPKDIDINLKIAATFIIQQLFLNDHNFSEKKIEDVIDDFINHYNSEYNNHMNRLVIISDQFDADLTFYYSYINKIKN